MPNFILQPLVENTIKHGASKNGAKSLISISALQNNGHLQLEVADNGAGIAENLEEGIGLSNTRERLERLYGKDFALNLKKCSKRRNDCFNDDSQHQKSDEN
ncbi:MAG: hypothetical protein HC846_07880 [Blastocatellia bacterium]|nr:hypothetical protein [Blastocatellia bacterium]